MYSSFLRTLLFLSSLCLVSCIIRQDTGEVSTIIFLAPEHSDKNLSRANIDVGNETTGLAALPKNCGGYRKTKTRIAGGWPARKGEFPSYVFVSLNDQASVYCGGTIISRYHILTAAHCVENLGGYIPRAIPGVDLPDFTIKSYNHLRVEKICKTKHAHPFPDTGELINDIAIMKLEKPLKFNKKTRPACLPPRKMVGRREKGFRVVGFGRTSELPDRPNRLQVLGVQEVGCRNYDGHFSTICFEPEDDSDLGDACHGDSGGGIMAFRDKKQYVVGTVSYGELTCRRGVRGYSVNANIFRLLYQIDILLKECA